METLDPQQVQQALINWVDAIAEDFKQVEAFAIAGIANGGMDIANYLASELSKRWGKDVPVGCVNTAFHRDDVDVQDIEKIYLPTDTPWETNDANILLVDDVLCSGRTVRAALGEIFQLGRPASVILAVVVDCEVTKLPIQADYSAMTCEIDASEEVKVSLDLESNTNHAITIEEK